MLALEWIGADNNGYLNGSEGALYHDRVKLIVHRTGAKARLVFTLTDSICPDNSARMIRRA